MELFYTVLDRRDAAQGFMGSMMVVAVQPVGRHIAHFLQRLEQVAVQHLAAVGLVESFDIGVLRRLARLMSLRAMPLDCSHLVSASAMNSGLLSRRIDSGAPWTMRLFL